MTEIKIDKLLSTNDDVTQVAGVIFLAHMILQTVKRDLRNFKERDL